MKPAGYTGALNTSVTLAGTLGLAAELKEMDREEARQALERSAEDFYGIP